MTTPISPSYRVSDLVDLPRFEELLTAFHATTGIPLALLDASETVLFAIGWRDICMRFHRRCPQTAVRCRLSGRKEVQYLVDRPFSHSRCENGLYEIAAPMIIDGHHVATIVSGQFLHAPPDEAWFSAQALACGFDEAAYLAAIREVPIISPEQIAGHISFIVQLTGLLAANGLDRVRHLESEAALRDREESYRRLLEMSPQPIFISHDGRFAYLNEAAQRLFSAARLEEIIGTPVLERVHPDYRELVQERMRLLLAGTTVPTIYEKFITIDGSEVDVILASSACRYQGEPAIQVVMTDITELKRTERAFEESTRRFRELAEMLPQIVFEIDCEGRFTFLNNNSFLVSGLSPDDLARGITPIEQLVPEDRARGIENIRRLLSGETTYGVGEYRLLRADGSSYPVTIYASTIFRDTDIVGARGIIIDISERIEADRALRESEQRFKELADLLPEAIFETDDRHRLLFMNRAGLELFGYSREEADQGIDAQMLIDPEDRARVQADGERLLRGEQLGNTEYTAIRKDGSTFRMRLSAAAILRDGRPVGVRGIAVDVTEWRRTEEELRQHRDHLGELVAARTAELETANTQLHQYQQRLRALATEATLVAEAERRQIAQQLHDQLGPLLFGVLLQIGKVQQSLEDSAQCDELTEARGMLERAMRYSRSLTAELSPPILYELGFVPALRWLTQNFSETYAVPVTFAASEQAPELPDQIGILLFNMARELLLNVVKHAQASHAGISVTTYRGECQVTVEDNGVGFDPASLSVDGPSRAGFGLFSIRERLKHLGGSLTIDAAPGAGARITLSISCAGEAVESKGASCQ